MIRHFIGKIPATKNFLANKRIEQDFFFSVKVKDTKIRKSLNQVKRKKNDCSYGSNKTADR